MLLPCPKLPRELEEHQEGWHCALPSPMSTDFKAAHLQLQPPGAETWSGTCPFHATSSMGTQVQKKCSCSCRCFKKKKICSVLLVNKLQANCSCCLGNLGLWLGLGCLLIKILGFWCLVALVCLGRGVRCAAAGDGKIKVQHLAVRKKH